MDPRSTLFIPDAPSQVSSAPIPEQAVAESASSVKSKTRLRVVAGSEYRTGAAIVNRMTQVRAALKPIMGLLLRGGTSRGDLSERLVDLVGEALGATDAIALALLEPLGPAALRQEALYNQAMKMAAGYVGDAINMTGTPEDPLRGLHRTEDRELIAGLILAAGAVTGSMLPNRTSDSGQGAFLSSETDKVKLAHLELSAKLARAARAVVGSNFLGPQADYKQVLGDFYQAAMALAGELIGKFPVSNERDRLILEASAVGMVGWDLCDEIYALRRYLAEKPASSPQQETWQAKFAEFPASEKVGFFIAQTCKRARFSLYTARDIALGHGASGTPRPSGMSQC